MNRISRHGAGLDIGLKLAVLSFIAVAIVFGVFAWMVGHAASEAAVRRALLIGLIVLLGLAALLNFAIRSMISRPLSQTTQIARQIATGDLTLRIDANRKDDKIGKASCRERVCQYV